MQTESSIVRLMPCNLAPALTAAAAASVHSLRPEVTQMLTVSHAFMS